MEKKKSLPEVDAPDEKPLESVLGKVLQECQRRRETGESVDYTEPEVEVVKKKRIPTVPELLVEMGVGTRHKNCTFSNYEGGVPLIKQITTIMRDEDAGIVFFGAPGGGKTHLAVAIMHVIVKKGLAGEIPDYKKHPPIFTTVPELLIKIRSTYRANSTVSEEMLIDQYASSVFLVLDDMGVEKSSDHSIATTEVIVDKRWRNEKLTIVTSNLSLEDIASKSSTRIASRLAGMRVINIKMPDYRMKRKGLKHD